MKKYIFIITVSVILCICFANELTGDFVLKYDFDAVSCRESIYSAVDAPVTRPLSIRDEIISKNAETVAASFGASSAVAIKSKSDGSETTITFDSGETAKFSYLKHLKIETLTPSVKLDDESAANFAEVLQNIPCVQSVGIAPRVEATGDQRAPEFIRFVKPSSKPDEKLKDAHDLLFPDYPNDHLVDHQWWYSSYSKLLQDNPSEAAHIVNSRVQDVHQMWTGGTSKFKILASDNVLNRHYDIMNKHDIALYLNEVENGGPWTGELGDTCVDSVDDDSNGLIDDCVGSIRFVDDPAHGTMSVGLMTGLTNNKVAMASVCPGCKSVMVGGFDPLHSLDYAILTDSKVLNMPYVYWRDAFYSENSRFREFVLRYVSMIRDAMVAYENHTDGLIITSAGNTPTDLDECTDEYFFTDPMVCKLAPYGFPCSLNTHVPNVVCVGASDRYGKPWQYATYGERTVSVFAPGSNIEVLWAESTMTRSGSSLSSAIVSGIAALVRSRFPDLSARQVKQILMASCRKGEGDALRHRCKCGGVVDAVNAMAHATVCTVDPDNCGQPLDPKIEVAETYEQIMECFCEMAEKYGKGKVLLCNR